MATKLTSIGVQWSMFLVLWLEFVRQRLQFLYIPDTICKIVFKLQCKRRKFVTTLIDDGKRRLLFSRARESSSLVHSHRSLINLGHQYSVQEN